MKYHIEVLQLREYTWAAYVVVGGETVFGAIEANAGDALGVAREWASEHVSGYRQRGN